MVITSLVGGVIGGAIDIGAQLLIEKRNFKELNWKSVGQSFVEGAISGAIAGATGGASLVASAGKQTAKLTAKQVAKTAGKTAVVHGTTGAAINAAAQYAVKGEVNTSEVILSGAIDSLTGGVGSALPHTRIGNAITTFTDNVATNAKGFINTALDNTRMLLADERGSIGRTVGKNIDDVVDLGSKLEINSVKSGINQLEPYAGVKQASEYLKSQGVPRDLRKRVLESFDRRTIYMDEAGKNTFGIRYHDFGIKAKQKGNYLYETFQPLSTREGAAIKWKWNEMKGISQYQIKPGTPIIKGKAAPQIENGVIYEGGIEQWWIYNLDDLIRL